MRQVLTVAAVSIAILFGLYFVTNKDIAKNISIPSPTQLTIPRSEIQSTKLVFEDPQLSCTSDDECVIYTCGCKGINKKYLDPKMNICMVICKDVEPKCINNKCTTVKSMPQERVQ